MRISLFGKSRAIETDIDEFLNKLSEAGILFEQLVKRFMESGVDEGFKEKVKHLNKMEKSANDLTSGIGRSLYTEMLIPDLRADVLSLIQNLDYLLDVYAKIATSFEIEQPDHSRASESAHRLYRELTENAVKSVEMTVISARAFFRDIGEVNDNVHKVGFYEAEVDSIAVQLKRQLFAQGIPLDLKMHYRYFIDALDQLADDAKDASEWIAIYAIKRTL